MTMPKPIVNQRRAGHSEQPTISLALLVQVGGMPGAPGAWPAGSEIGVPVIAPLVDLDLWRAAANLVVAIQIRSTGVCRAMVARQAEAQVPSAVPPSCLLGAWRRVCARLRFASGSGRQASVPGYVHHRFATYSTPSCRLSPASDRVDDVSAQAAAMRLDRDPF